jgi:hypothetical protein
LIEIITERDSPRDQLVVTLFLLTVFGLLLGAGIKKRMQKAGIEFDTSTAWNAGRHWWQVSYDIPEIAIPFPLLYLAHVDLLSL